MPTPNIYTDPDWNPFSEVPAELQSDEISVLYITDRVPDPESQEPDQWQYGLERSRSTAFGETIVQMGSGMTWNQIVQVSREAKRQQKVELTITATREQARFTEKPPVLVLSDLHLDSGKKRQADPVQARAEQQFRDELSRRLALTPRKEVFIYVHGFANTFENAVFVTAEMWHFLGREGVPICYTWPAGIGGVKAYEYTLASTQVTVYHFKQALRLIASCPEVEKVHIIAHSRGTAVTTDTIRELHLEIRSTADTQKTLKLGTVILAAADIDLDVSIARNATERIVRAVEHCAVYISSTDKALSFSNWLFGGRSRLGDLDVNMFSPSELEVLRTSRYLQLIDARLAKPGTFGHGYFHENPGVSSDLALMMRYQLWPGSEHGRPLQITEQGIWLIEDGYPGTDWKMPKK
ncbi:MAG: alpha/beta hydrolase [Planctomycetota bacterium]|jgi:esterase/lipase superfamily enzyme